MPHTAARVQVAIEAMRTRFELVLIGDDEARLRSAGEAALAEIAACEARLSPFRVGSLVSRINGRAHLGAVAVDGDTFELLALCRRVWSESGGAFDVTVGPLMHAWGFRGGAPDPEAAGRAVWGMSHVQLDDAASTVAFDRPGIALDLGAVGKGHALDLAAAELRAAGVETAFLHAGTSSVLTIGEGAEGGGWRVGLAADGPVVSLRGAALGVSAQRGRSIEGPSGPLGHVLDPRSGRPATGVAAACVIGAGAAAADAWSTALLVMGTTGSGMPGDQTGIIDHGEGAVPRWSARGPHSHWVSWRAAGGTLHEEK